MPSGSHGKTLYISGSYCVTVAIPAVPAVGAAAAIPARNIVLSGKATEKVGVLLNHDSSHLAPQMTAARTAITAELNADLLARCTAQGVGVPVIVIEWKKPFTG